VLITKPLSGGSATFVTSSLNAGTHTINVTYAGDSNFKPGTGTLSPDISNGHHELDP